MPSYEVSDIQTALKNSRLNTAVAQAVIACGGLGCLFVLLGLTSTTWVVAPNNSHAGLFRFCELTCNQYAAEGTMAGTKVLLVLSLSCALTGMIIWSTYYRKFYVKDVLQKTLPVIGAAMYLTAAGLAVGGSVLFIVCGKKEAETALNVEMSLGYSLYLVMVGGAFFGSACLLCLMHRHGILSTLASEVSFV